MINGYWTALATIMLAILLLTGWSNWLNERIKLVILIPAVSFIWCDIILDWNVKLALGTSELRIELSFTLICILILLYDLLLNPELDIQLIGLYTIAFSVAMTMVRAFTLFAPWAGASIAYWHLPFLSGTMLGLLNARFSQLVLIAFFSLSAAEVLLIWQQRGEYDGIIGNLKWWDDIALSIFGIVVMKLLIIVIHKLALQFNQLIGKRMKS